MDYWTATQSTNFYLLLDKPRVYADLNGGWREGDNYVLWLNSSATESDLLYLGYSLASGLVVDFWTDDGDDEGNLDPLLFRGKVDYDEEKQKWFAVTPWDSFQHASKLKQKPSEPAHNAERAAAHAR